MSDLGEPHVNEQSKRLLKLVYIMGVILMLLFFGLVAGIIYKAKTGAVVVPPETQELSIGLPPDEKFTDVVLSGDRLIIIAGRKVYVIDIRSKRVILRVNGVQE